LALSGTVQAIIGLGVALSSSQDTCAGPQSGNVLAQGVIGIKNIDNNFAEYEATVVTAVAILFPSPNCSTCHGTVWLTQSPTMVTVTAQLFGLVAPSVHEINIHQYGDMSVANESLLGRHYNPNGRDHALPPTLPRHMGDLGNVQSYSVLTNSAWYQYSTSNIPDIHEVVGRPVVIDSLPDHGVGPYCDDDGNAGIALMFGVIGLANPNTLVPNLPSDVVINNNFQNLPCPAPSVSHTGLTAALVIGWVIAGLLLIVVVAMVLYYFLRLRQRADYQEF